MKSHVVKFLMLGFVFVWAACEIVDPFLIALNLPLEACASIDDGSSWNGNNTYNIRNEIANVSTDYVNGVEATRVNDISIHMPSPPAAGEGSGIVQFSIDGELPLRTLLTFNNVPFSLLAGNGISLKDETSGGGSMLIDFDATNVAYLLSRMQDSTGLPASTTIQVVTSGSTSVTVPAGTQICASVAYQVDVEI